jgi:hypothetical protein
MICDPCKRDVHLGEDVKVKYTAYPDGWHGISVTPPLPIEVCRGGNWCDCAHRPRR